MNTFDLDAIRREIQFQTGSTVSPLAGIAYDLALRLHEALAEHQAALATIEILRRGGPAPVNGPAAAATGARRLNDYDDAITTDDGRGDLRQVLDAMADDHAAMEQAFIRLAAAIEHLHAYRDERDTEGEPMCDPACGACELVQFIPFNILAAAGVANDCDAIVNQGDQQ